MFIDGLFCARHYWKSLCINSFNSHKTEVVPNMAFTIQMKKLIYREVKKFDRGHTATKWRNQDSSLVCLAPKPIFLTLC